MAIEVRVELPPPPPPPKPDVAKGTVTITLPLPEAAVVTMLLGRYSPATRLSAVQEVLADGYSSAKLRKLIPSVTEACETTIYFALFDKLATLAEKL